MPPGTASGTGAAAMTTARRSARAIPTNARSTPSRSPGACCPGEAIRRARARRWRRRPGSWSTRSSRSSSCSRRRSTTRRKEPGYIKSYPPGVRENGGQYTHAATWFVIALAEMGKADEAYRCFSMLNPVNHALDADGGRAVPRRTLCRGGRHLFGAGQGRPRRLDLVHRLGRLDVPRRGRRASSASARRATAFGQASPARATGMGIQGHAATFRRGLPDPSEARRGH